MLQTEKKFPICFAPMVGLSNVVARRVIRDYLPEGVSTYWPTEMLNSRRLPSEILGSTPETKKLFNEDGLVPQILGNEEKFIEASIKKLQDWGAVGIDINMGCPVKKALKHNYGVALMGNTDYAKSVVAMAKKSSSLPVSVKLRAMSEGRDQFIVDFVGALVNEGATRITLHPRTQEQKRRGRADWNQIQFLRDAFPKIQIVGNGDVQTCQDVIDMLRLTNCDQVMVGRSLLARPWMVWQFGEATGLKEPDGKQGQRAPQTSREEAIEYGRVLDAWIEYSREYFAEDYAIRKLKFYVRMSSMYLDYGHKLISLLSLGKDLNDIQHKLREFFKSELHMCQKSDLRI